MRPIKGRPASRNVTLLDPRHDVKAKGLREERGRAVRQARHAPVAHLAIQFQRIAARAALDPVGAQPGRADDVVAGTAAI